MANMGAWCSLFITNRLAKSKIYLLAELRVAHNLGAITGEHGSGSTVEATGNCRATAASRGLIATLHTTRHAVRLRLQAMRIELEEVAPVGAPSGHTLRRSPRLPPPPAADQDGAGVIQRRCISQIDEGSILSAC